MSGLAFVSPSKPKEMRFDVPKVKRHLVDHGRVYTVRKGGPAEGGDAEFTAHIYGVPVHVKHVGRCLRFHVKRVWRAEQLEEYLSHSGFDRVEEWWSWIRRFGAENGSLWDVRVMHPEEGLEKWIN